MHVSVGVHGFACYLTTVVSLAPVWSIACARTEMLSAELPLQVETILRVLAGMAPRPEATDEVGDLVSVSGNARRLLPLLH